MKITREFEKFQWIGEGVKSVGKRSSKTRYRAFSLRHLIIEIGDFVLVRNDDALDPEDCMSCFVAQVKDLFDTGNDIDPYQAQVQWFSRVTELPAYAIKLIKNVGHDFEIVKDTRQSWYNLIDAETIFQKCEVLFLPADADYECALLEYSDCPFPVFFCRYSFTGISLHEVKDKPISDSRREHKSKKNQNANGFVAHSYDETQDSATNEKGLPVKETVQKYCAFQIGSPSKCPRVLIKRIDSGIFDSSDKNVRIFVADTNVKKVEEVADIFLNRLQKTDEQNENVEKNPIIHSLISSNNTPKKNICTEDNELMDYDSNVESEICNNVETKICSLTETSSGKKIELTPLSKSCKNLCSYKFRNSPRKSIPSKNLFSSPTKNVKHENLEKQPLIHTFKSENNLGSNATEEFSSSDSDMESKTMVLRNSRKSCSSKKLDTPLHSPLSKKVNMNANDIGTDTGEEIASSDHERQSRRVETPKTRKSSCKNTATPLRNQACKKLNRSRKDLVIDSTEEFAVDEHEMESKETGTPKIKNSSLSKKTVTPLRNQACKKLNLNENNQDTCTTEELHKGSETVRKMTDTPKTRRKDYITNIGSPLHSQASKKLDTDTVKKSPNKSGDLDAYSTPKKRAKFADITENFCLTRSGRRVKSINYSESASAGMISVTPTKTTLPRYVRNECSGDSDSSNFDSGKEGSSDDDSSVSDEILLDETSHKKKKNILKSDKSRTLSRRSLKDSNVQITPVRKAFKNLCIPERKTPLRTPKNALEESRQRLHVSAVPNSLPCRDEEYSDIYSFVKGCLCAQTGGCMYISGVPGTGKTATVHEVMRNLEEEKEMGEIPIFTFVEVNGMWMTDPYQCYVQIFKALTGKTIAPQQAADLLEKRFTERGPKKDAVVLLVDELDRLWTRKQTVMYNIFDWPTKKNSKLIVLAIANTMDLPERMMMNRISSRLGLTRKTFQPYTFKQLQEIIMSRIQELKVFDPDAVQLVARKVAAVSGDARRALDICRFATETVKVGSTAKKGQKVLVGMAQVDTALQQMFSSPVISAIRSSSKIAKLFFQCILSEFTRTGIEETTLLKVHRQVVSLCNFEGLPSPNSTEISRICSDLAASHLILVDNFRNDLYMKIRLNVSSDDVTYALTLK